MGNDDLPPNLTVLPGGDNRLEIKQKAADDAAGGPGKGEAVRAGMTKAAQARRDVLQMRAGGATIEQIARTLSKSEKGVGTILRNIFDKWEAQIEEGLDEALKLELHRIDVALTAVWPKVVNAPAKRNEPPPFSWGVQREAIELMLKLQARRARYLGLDAPEKHEHSGVVHHEVFDPKEVERIENDSRALPPADVELTDADVVELPGG